MGVVKHPFTSPKADGGDATLVRPSNWNADHTSTLTAADVGAGPSGAEYFVQTAHAGLSAEIVINPVVSIAWAGNVA